MRLLPPFCSLEEYQANRPERIPSEELEEHCIYTVMMRLKGRGPEALCLPAGIADIRRMAGGIAMLLYLKRADFSDFIQNKGQVGDGLWTPDRRDRLTIRGMGVKVNAVEGYFLPYDDGVDLSHLYLTADEPRELVGASSSHSATAL